MSREDISKKLKDTDEEIKSTENLLNQNRQAQLDMIKELEDMGASPEKIEALRKMLGGDNTETKIETKDSKENVDKNDNSASSEKNKESTKEKNDRELREQYYDKAVAEVEKSGKTTFTNLEKKFKISAAKARRLVEMLKEGGVIAKEEKIKEKTDIEKAAELSKETKAEMEKAEAEKNKGKEKEPEKTEEPEKEIEPILKPNEEEKGAEKSLNIDWRLEKYGNIEQLEGKFSVDMGNEEIVIRVEEDKTRWKEYSKWKKLLSFGLLKGKYVLNKEKTWDVWHSGDCQKFEEKYSEVYEHKTKEEAINKANQMMIDALIMKIEAINSRLTEIKEERLSLIKLID